MSLYIILDMPTQALYMIPSVAYNGALIKEFYSKSYNLEENIFMNILNRIKFTERDENSVSCSLVLTQQEYNNQIDYLKEFGKIIEAVGMTSNFGASFFILAQKRH